GGPVQPPVLHLGRPRRLPASGGAYWTVRRRPGLSSPDLPPQLPRHLAVASPVRPAGRAGLHGRTADLVRHSPAASQALRPRRGPASLPALVLVVASALDVGPSDAGPGHARRRSPGDARPPARAGPAVAGALRPCHQRRLRPGAAGGGLVGRRLVPGR